MLGCKKLLSSKDMDVGIEWVYLVIETHNVPQDSFSQPLSVHALRYGTSHIFVTRDHMLMTLQTYHFTATACEYIGTS